MTELKHVFDGDMDKGYYWQALAGLELRRTALVCCPQCGEVFSLSQHTIAEDGTVSPSVVHSRDGCTFHDFVKLLDWPGQPAHPTNNR